MKNYLYKLSGVILLILLQLFFCGCSDIQYVPIESHSIEHHYHNDTVKEKDTVYQENTTVIREADSAMLAKLGIKLENNERAILILRSELQKAVSQMWKTKIDTIIRIDTTRVPYPVERQLTKWEQTKMDTGGITLTLCIAFIIIVIVRFLVRAYRKT